MYALEALARVDVLCLDKTGTITDGEMKVCEKIDAYGMPPQFVQEMLEDIWVEVKTITQRFVHCGQNITPRSSGR